MAMGIDDYNKLTLATIGDGALEEKFQHELKKVLENIDDPNAADGKREINMKVVFQPAAQGKTAGLTLAASSKIQPDVPKETMAYLGREGNAHVAWEHNPEQLKLPVGEGHIAAAPAKVIGGDK